MNSAAYIRVSSRSQNLATQRHALSQLIREGEVAWYEEKRSAKTMDRPELRRLLADAAAGRVSKLYLFKLDRLTRSGVADTVNTVDFLRAHGCTVVTAADGLPPLAPGELPMAASIVLTVLALAAQIELSIKNDRISAARERYAAKNLPWGRPRRHTPEQAAKVAELKAAGKTVRQISMAVHLPRSTVQRLCRPSQKDGAGEASAGPS